MADGLQLFTQAMNVKHHRPLVQIHSAFVSENIEGAGGEQLQRQSDLPRLCLRLLQQFFPQGCQSGDRAVLLRLRVYDARAAVNDGFLLRPHALGVNALYQGHNELRFHHDGVVLAVTIHHIHICVSRT